MLTDYDVDGLFSYLDFPEADFDGTVIVVSVLSFWGLHYLCWQVDSLSH